MIDVKKLESIGLTPGKAILIAVLLLIFIGVVVSNFMPAETAPIAKSENRKRPIRKVANRTARGKVKQNESESSGSKKIKDWPSIDLDKAIAHDPFELPLELQPPKTEEPKTAVKQQERDPEMDIQLLRERQRQVRKEKLEALKALQDSGAAIALVTPEEKLITYGNKKLRVGDKWEGFRIIEIRPDGSVVVDIE